MSARDAIHVAVMQGRDIGTVMSFDRGFDGIPGIIRLGVRTDHPRTHELNTRDRHI